MLRVVEAQRVAEEEEAAARKSFQEGVSQQTKAFLDLAEPLLIQTWTAEEAAQNLVSASATKKSPVSKKRRSRRKSSPTVGDDGKSK